MKSIILYSALLVVVITIGVIIYTDKHNGSNEAAKGFLGDWKLEKLDSKDCERCKLKLYNDYHYDIIVGNQIVDRGNWNLGFDNEEGGYYLEIYKDQSEMIWDQPKVIYNLDRSDKL